MRRGWCQPEMRDQRPRANRKRDRRVNNWRFLRKEKTRHQPTSYSGSMSAMSRRISLMDAKGSSLTTLKIAVSRLVGLMERCMELAVSGAGCRESSASTTVSLVSVRAFFFPPKRATHLQKLSALRLPSRRRPRHCQTRAGRIFRIRLRSCWPA